MLSSTSCGGFGGQDHQTGFPIVIVFPATPYPEVSLLELLLLTPLARPWRRMPPSSGEAVRHDARPQMRACGGRWREYARARRLPVRDRALPVQVAA